MALAKRRCGFDVDEKVVKYIEEIFLSKLEDKSVEKIWVEEFATHQ